MSIHIGAPKGAIAPNVLLPGDPLRAKFIAETYLEDVVCYNNVRGMLGFTGTYKGIPVSVQGTGMGMASASIYINELINFYGCKKLIRVGSAGSMQEDIKVLDCVIATGACHNSGTGALRFPRGTFAPVANFDLVRKMVGAAEKKAIPHHVGSVLSSDLFYNPNPDDWKHWASYGVLAVEMEAAELFTLGAQYGVQCAAVVTISDSLITGEETTSEERERRFTDMINLALSAFEEA